MLLRKDIGGFDRVLCVARGAPSLLTEFSCYGALGQSIGFDTRANLYASPGNSP